MIHVNLNEILKDKGISISQLSKITGISRNSLTALANNESTMVKFETLNKLLINLDTNLVNLLQYSPDFDFKISESEVRLDGSQIATFLKFNNSNQDLKLYGNTTISDDIYRIKWPIFTRNPKKDILDSFTQAFLNSLPKADSEGNLPNSNSLRDNVQFISDKLLKESILPLIRDGLIKFNTLYYSSPTNIDSQWENLVIIVEFQLDFLIEKGINCPQTLRTTYDYTKIKNLQRGVPQSSSNSFFNDK